MKEIVTTKEFAAIRFGTDTPSKSQVNTISKMCALGTIKHADRVGKTWLINAAKELPNCYA